MNRIYRLLPALPALLAVFLAAGRCEAQNLSKLYAAVNAERVAWWGAGAALAVDPRLEAAAAYHVKWCKEHRSDGHWNDRGSPYQQALAAGYRPLVIFAPDGQIWEQCTNLIARHKGTPEYAVTLWWASYPRTRHYEIMLDPDWVHMGAASGPGWDGRRITVLFLATPE
jgi:uncharacterized protein YkwD